MNPRTRFLARAALIAALYAVLTLLSALFGLSGGMVQLRLSEALTVLPVFFPEAVPGLFVGCLLSNLITGCAPWDIVFGSLATLLGALGTRKIRRMPAALLPPILCNTLILPPVLIAVYGLTEGYLLITLCILTGEALSCGILGYLLWRTLKKRDDLFH